MNRLAFIRRMALAAAACAFIDVPWPKEWDRRKPRLVIDYDEGAAVVDTWTWRPDEKVWEHTLWSAQAAEPLERSWHYEAPFHVVRAVTGP